jgi:hypothetical protein
MSLEVAAKHLAAHGRHGDSTLVHMSPNEVAGLQALARSKGKSLSTNPHTGLPEAFDLGQELGNATSGIGATVTGAALAIAFPELAAMGYAIPAIVGGTHYAATGNAGESVMGGVGAYGGQSVAGNVMGAGTGAVESQAGAALPAGATEAEVEAAVNSAAQNATPYDKLAAGAQSVWNNPNTIQALGGWKTLAAAAAPAVFGAMKPKTMPTTAQNPQMIRPYKFEYNPQTVNTPLTASYVPGQDTSERKWFAPTYIPSEPYKAADGGIVALAGGGPVEQMSNENAIGANTGFPQAYLHNAAYATPYQTPMSQNVLIGAGDTRVDPYTGEEKMAAGGITDLGGYSDGGRLLRGPGDGVSDSIPAQIGHNQPARLADGEFVVPARIVSELGNGSTEAGARQLYKMLDRVQQARGKTTGKNKVAHNTNAAKYLPA